jgi:hypothetical protein
MAGKKCPLNALLTLPISHIIDSKYIFEKEPMNNNWAGYKISNHPDNSLLADLRVRLSRPCGSVK